MGEIILLQDTYKFELPKMPSNEKEILFYDKKKADQYWIRPQMPDFKRMSVREKTIFIDEERRRIEDGIWIMLNGNPVYITGGHYDFLRYNNFPDFDGNPAYYDAQRLDFYFQQFVEEDKNCYGEIIIKPRRYGYTAIGISRAQRKAMSDGGMHVGLVSTDKDKAIETMFRPLVESYMSRPAYAKAEIYQPNGRTPQKEMRFNKNKVKKKKRAEDEDEDDEIFGSEDGGLRSWISPRATTTKAFDGHKWHFVIMDEIYKWTQASLYNTWNITKEALQVGGEINGKAALFATMGDDDSYDQAVKDGIKLWNESNYNERNQFGETQSGLFRYFIPSYVAFKKFIDKYGICDHEKAREYQTVKRAEVARQYGEDSKEYLYHIRKYPWTAEEAMSAVGESGTFSKMRIDSQIKTNIILSSSTDLYTKGYFKPSANGATFQPDRSGFWKIKGHPADEAKNRCKFNDKKKKWSLPPNPEGLIGNDPVRTADNTSDHLSNNAAYVYQKFDYYNNGFENQLVAQLFGRDDDVDFFNEQLRLACLYWAMPLNTERQITSTWDWFRARGMADFILLDDEGAHGMWTTAKLIKDGIELIQAYIKKSKEEGEVSWLDLIVFEELLEQLKEFEKSKSTKFDCVMALIITFLGAAKIKKTVISASRNKHIQSAISAMIPSR